MAAYKILLSDRSWDYFHKYCSGRKFYDLLVWLSFQEFYDARSSELKEIDNIRRVNNLELIWYDPDEERRFRRIKLEEQTLIKLFVVGKKFGINKIAYKKINYYQSPISIVGHVLEAIGQQNLVPTKPFPVIKGNRTRKKFTEIQW